LHIHEDVAIYVGRHLRDSLCAGTVVLPSHSRMASESGYGINDAAIVGGHDDFLNALCQFGTGVYSLNHRLTVN
jgi:hypothetical protein